MNRWNGRVLKGWRLWVALPLLLPLAVLVLPWSSRKTRDRTPAEVANHLRDFLNGTGGEGDWDAFQSTPISDPELDRIRQQASHAAPSPKRPSGDRVKLLELLHRADSLAAIAAERALVDAR